MTLTQPNFVPKILFAHKFSAAEYHGKIPASPSKVEITTVTEGELTLEQNGIKHVARQGDVICNLYRSEITVYALERHTHHTVCYDVDFDADGEEAVKKIPLVTRSMQGTESCARLIDGIIRAHLLSPENTLRLSGLFLQLIGELSAIADLPDGCSPSDRNYVNRVKRYIYNNISLPIQQKDIAAHLGVTPEHLCSVFKRSEGKSVIRYINEIKLQHVRTLMETKGVSLNQAASQIGFSDPNYVSRLYKKYYGRTLTGDVNGRS